MPIYTHKCIKGHKFDVYAKIEDYNAPQVCECGEESRRITVPTMIAPDMANWDRFISPTTGKLITSYRERREDMAQSGCSDYEPSLKNEVGKRQKADDEKLDKLIDETVVREIEGMDAKSREKLGTELERGADISLERKTV